MDTNLNVWELIQNNRFEEASYRADLEFEQTKNIFPLRNKIYALMHLKKYDQLISLCKQLIEHENGDSDTEFIFCGIGYWALDRKTDAIKIWEEAKETKYTDAAGGVILFLILFFASVKTENKALREHSLKKLKKLMKSKVSVNWPGTIAPFVLGDIAEDGLMSKILSLPFLKERQSCQAHFAIAVKK